MCEFRSSFPFLSLAPFLLPAVNIVSTQVLFFVHFVFSLDNVSLGDFTHHLTSEADDTKISISSSSSSPLAISDVMCVNLNLVLFPSNFLCSLLQGTPTPFLKPEASILSFAWMAEQTVIPRIKNSLGELQ